MELDTLLISILTQKPRDSANAMLEKHILLTGVKHSNPKSVLMVLV